MIYILRGSVNIMYIDFRIMRFFRFSILLPFEIKILQCTTWKVVSGKNLVLVGSMKSRK